MCYLNEKKSLPANIDFVYLYTRYYPEYEKWYDSPGIEQYQMVLLTIFILTDPKCSHFNFKQLKEFSLNVQVD